jgi:hypothetical protein
MLHLLRENNVLLLRFNVQMASICTQRTTNDERTTNGRPDVSPLLNILSYGILQAAQGLSSLEGYKGYGAEQGMAVSSNHICVTHHLLCDCRVLHKRNAPPAL